MPGRLTRLVMVGAVLLISLWPIANTYRRQQKEDWRTAVQYVSTDEQPDDVIVLVDEDIWLPFEHYYHGATRRIGISRVVTDESLLAARVGVILPNHNRIWLILSHTDNYAIKDHLISSRYAELVSERHFTGVEVDLFNIQSSIAERSQSRWHCIDTA